MTRIHGWIPILIMLGLGAGFGAFNVGLSLLLGPKKPTPEKLAPYSAACRRSATRASATRSSSTWWR